MKGFNLTKTNKKYTENALISFNHKPSIIEGFNLQKIYTENTFENRRY
jgi:hypothetical protein